MTGLHTTPPNALMYGMMFHSRDHFSWLFNFFHLIYILFEGGRIELDTVSIPPSVDSQYVYILYRAITMLATAMTSTFWNA